ncbi:Mut7-C RNAse domain-containing protein [Candidatus Bathyarchaeota archaeon]|nr:Mut7-C RNAse domain-containing protein [Candidatus Bathyarchaeota archaeon]
MKFLVDGMLGKLAKWLRLMGYDVKYSIFPDKTLITEAIKENRILLTSDIALYREATAKGVETYLVKGKNEVERIAEIAKKFNLKIEVNAESARCPLCGSTLTKIDKMLIKEMIPTQTFKFYSEFFICSNQNCRKIYWQGSHWKKINEVLLQAKKLTINAKERKIR